MLDAKNAIEFIQSDIEELTRERDETLERSQVLIDKAAEMHASIDKLNDDISALRSAVARYKAKVPAHAELPPGPDPKLVALRGKPFSVIIEYMGDKYSEVILLSEAYEDLDAAGFVRYSAALRTALSTKKNWKNIGRGRWQRVRKADAKNGHQPDFVMAGVAPIQAKGRPTGYCMKCRETTAMTNAIESVAKNGRLLHKGQCAVCGTGTSQFVKAA